MWQIGKHFIRDLEAELKVFRHLGDQTGEIFFIGKFVIDGVHVDAFEDLGIFRQAIFLKAGFGKFAAVFVAVAVVEPSRLAGIFRTSP